MRIDRLADLFEHKYKTAASDQDIRDGIAGIYKRFMLEYNGSIAQLKLVYGLPYLEELHTVFSVLVSRIDTLDHSEIVKIGKEVLVLIEKIRIELNDTIKTNVNDPAYTAFFMRKRLASTVDKAMESLQFLLKRQLQEVAISLPEHTKRRRMTQTPAQTESLVLEYGDQYGVNDMEDWGKIVHKNYDLAFALMTSFLGHRRGNKKIKTELANEVKRLLGR